MKWTLFVVSTLCHDDDAVFRLLDVKSGLRNESGWSKKINKIAKTLRNPGAELKFSDRLTRGAKIQKKRKIAEI